MVPVGSQGIGSAEAGTKEFLLIFGGGSGERDAGQYTMDEEAKKLVYGRKDRANRQRKTEMKSEGGCLSRSLKDYFSHSGFSCKPPTKFYSSFNVDTILLFLWFPERGWLLS